jgi:hypothetical protein
VVSVRIVKLGEQPAINRLSFEDIAKAEWRTAKDAHLDITRRVQTLMELLYKPGQVRVVNRVTGAAHEAKQLRRDIDRLILALDEIIDAGKRVSE